MVEVIINGERFPAVVTARPIDANWDGRSTKTIRLTMAASRAAELLPDGTSWAIAQGEEIYDNSEFCLSGEIVDHRDGTVSVKMGKKTMEEELEEALEEAYELLFGGIE